MKRNTISGDEHLASALAAAWGSVERILTGCLASTQGITFSEYRLLSAIASGPTTGSSRVDLARSVGLSASAVTRALRPLEKLGIVTTTKHPRDARFAIAGLTARGETLVFHAGRIVHDEMAQIADRSNHVNLHRTELLLMLEELARL